MSRYVVRVVQRDGNEWFVFGDMLSDWSYHATHFDDPAVAHDVADKWTTRFYPDEAYIDVIDMDDPERGSIQEGDDE